MKIIHGDQEIESYKYLTQKTQNQAFLTFEASSLDLTSLRQVLSDVDLFGVRPKLFIRGLFSLPKSKKKTALMEEISKYQQDDHILYENKKISDSELKSFSKTEIICFDPPQIIFKFLESIVPGNYKQSSLLLDELQKTQDDSYVFFMLIAHFKKLVIVSDNPTLLKAPPFIKQKLQKQSRYFRLPQLIKYLNDLVDIDIRRKEGALPLSLIDSLKQFLFNLSFS